MSPAAAAAALLFLAGCASGPEPLTGACGGEPGLYVFASFASAELRERTTHVRAIVRESPNAGDGCAALWSGEPSTLPQQEKIVRLIGADEGILFPIALDEYPELDVFVYAQESETQTTTQAVAGGCAIYRWLDEGDTQCILVEATANPSRD